MFSDAVRDPLAQGDPIRGIFDRDAGDALDALSDRRVALAISRIPTIGRRHAVGCEGVSGVVQPLMPP